MNTVIFAGFLLCCILAYTSALPAAVNIPIEVEPEHAVPIAAGEELLEGQESRGYGWHGGHHGGHYGGHHGGHYGGHHGGGRWGGHHGGGHHGGWYGRRR